MHTQENNTHKRGAGRSSASCIPTTPLSDKRWRGDSSPVAQTTVIQSPPLTQLF